MRERILRHRVGVAIIVAVFSIAFAVRAAPVVHADDPPLGDCFGGALSSDPLHCYVLEQAQRRDVIDIEAIYDFKGTFLYVFLRQDDPIGDSVGRFFREKSHEFADRWRDRVTEPPDWARRYCASTPIRFWPGVPVGGKRDCLVDSMTFWASDGDTLLSYSPNYENFLFRVGGEEARQSEPGWIRGGMRKVWPAAVSGASGATGASSATLATFDVSGVDMTNLPVHACPELPLGTRADVCSRDQDVALSVAGASGGDGKYYVQVKDPPEDEAGLLALKKILRPCYEQLGSCTYTATTTLPLIVNGVKTEVATSTQISIVSNFAGSYENMVIIPVKYNPGESRRWVEILNRFANSPGNTIGIVRAKYDDNKVSTPGITPPVQFWPLDTLGLATSASEVRSTIRILAIDGQIVVDSLPVLLPLLGIPVDAVGLVLEYEKLAFIEDYGSRTGFPPMEDVEYPLEYSDRPVLHRYAARIGVSSIVLIGVTGVGAVLVVGGAVALALRLRRRALG